MGQHRGLPEPSTDAFEERAAIIEAKAGIPCEWAEGFARLSVMPCPAGIAPARWQQLIDDAGRFIDRWATQAAALGWSTLDVFGCHRGAPDARYDFGGLVWLICGKEVFAIDASAAWMRTRTGAEQLYERRPVSEPGRVAAWELVDR